MTAMLAAVDGGGALWDVGGLWLGKDVAGFYGWRRPHKVLGWLAAFTGIVALVPVIVAMVAAAGYVVAFTLTVLGVPGAASLSGWVSTVGARAFAGEALPTLVPRAVMGVGLVALAMVAADLWLAVPRGAGTRVVKGVGRGWGLVSAPFDTSSIRQAVRRSLWNTIRGAGQQAVPGREVLGHRYAELLGESLGQPGCRELMMAVTDLDARRDIVGAFLAGPYRARFLMGEPWPERSVEVLDLAREDGGLVVDLLDAALTPGLGAEPRSLAYSVDGGWQGETHRACDRPGLLLRLLRELRLADVRQVVIVSAATPPSGARELRPPSLRLHARVGEFLTAAEGATCQEAVATAVALAWFDAVYVIGPEYNALGAFAFDGADDVASERHWSLAELLQQGHRDAHAKFIDPVVGASGEQLTRVTMS